MLKKTDTPQVFWIFIYTSGQMEINFDILVMQKVDFEDARKKLNICLFFIFCFISSRRTFVSYNLFLVVWCN